MVTCLILTSSNGTTTNDSVALKDSRKFRDMGDLRGLYQLLPRCTTRQDRELLVHLLFSRELKEGLPPEVIRSASTGLIPEREEHKRSIAYNLVARLGASSKRGGTRPKHHSNTSIAQIPTRGISAESRTSVQPSEPENLA